MAFVLLQKYYIVQCTDLSSRDYTITPVYITSSSVLVPSYYSTVQYISLHLHPERKESGNVVEITQVVTSAHDGWERSGGIGGLS